MNKDLKRNMRKIILGLGLLVALGSCNKHQMPNETVINQVEEPVGLEEDSLNINSETTSKDVEPIPVTQEEETKTEQWMEVYTFKGSGMKKSPTFELTGSEARLKYKYESQHSGMGMFAVYIVDEGKDIMKQGGIPEVMSTEEKEESESSIQKSAGRYYLNVNCIGKWKVTVEELR